MKHPFLATALLSMTLFTSCDLGDDTKIPGSYADSATYLTVYVVDSLEDEGEKEYYFKTDSDIKIFLEDNAMTVDYAFAEQERIIGFFSVLAQYELGNDGEYKGEAYGCEYGIRLFGINKVYTSQSVTVTTEEESDEIPDHALAYIYNNIGYNYGYINLLAGVRADDIDDVSFYLVENLSSDPKEEKEGYLNLELRYDRATEEAIGIVADQYISLSLEDFAEKLEGKDGVLLRALTSNSGTIYIEIEIDQEDDESRSKKINKISPYTNGSIKL